MKTLITILTLVFTFSVNAQNFTGKATYKTHSKMDISFGDDKKNAPNKQMQEELQAQLKKMSQKTFTLNFNKFESTYKENESLSAPQPMMGTKMITISSGGSSDVLYKNIKENKFAKKSDIMGKVFLIKDDIKKHRCLEQT
mgnify:CR=1 FL=1